MTFCVEVEQETDGRWFAEVMEISGALSYGASRDEAVSKFRRSRFGSWPIGSTMAKKVPAS